MEFYLPVCSYDAPGVKTGPALGVTSLNIGTKKETSKLFFSERHRAPIFGKKHLLGNLYQFCAYDSPGVKTGPTSGVTSSNIGTMKETLELFFSET